MMRLEAMKVSSVEQELENVRLFDEILHVASPLNA